MTNAFNVDHEQLRVHAGKLAGYADQLANTGTRLPNELGEQSLGQFSQFLSAGLGGAMAEVRNTLNAVASTVDKVSLGMRQVADEYQRTDDSNVTSLTSAGEGAR